jgi:hypothetical protein
MKRQLLLIFAAASALAGTSFAQEKNATPKSEKPADKPKVLTFEPGVKLPEGGTVTTSPKADQSSKPSVPSVLLDGPSQVVTVFFGSLQEGKIDDAYATLTRGSKIAEKPEELLQLKAKTREAIEVFGPINGFDYVESRSIGRRIVRATYVSLGKVFPLRWRFYFYKPENVWRLIDLRVDDKLTGIFDEPAEAKPAEPPEQ